MGPGHGRDWGNSTALYVSRPRTAALHWLSRRLILGGIGLAFGFIGTRLTQSFEDDPATIEVHGRSFKVGFPARVAEAMEPRIPLGRAGTVEEAAGAVTLLCLPESDYISGQILEVAGGF